jgi:hypothetical protein
MSTQHEHEFEAAPGLPEKLPAGEHIIWQGAPKWRSLGVAAFGLRTIAMYLLVMWLLHFAHLWDQGSSAPEMAKYLGMSGAFAALAMALLGGFTYLVSSTTLYTLTNRRLVMRIGVVLGLTLNLPFRQITGASLKPLARGTGDLAVQIKPDSHIAYLHLWPHARAWHFKAPQPTLRCIADAEAVSNMLLQAWRMENPSERMLAVEATSAPATAPNHGLMA